MQLSQLRRKVSILFFALPAPSAPSAPSALKIFNALLLCEMSPGRHRMRARALPKFIDVLPHETRSITQMTKPLKVGVDSNSPCVQH